MPFKNEKVRDWVQVEKSKDPAFDEAYNEVKMAYNLVWQLARIRKESGLSQAELAQKADIQQQAVSRMETGKHIPSLKNVCRIADQLGYRIVLERKQAQ
ncbi:MAG: helix-turn-helix transcriptional regulator [Bacillota bacterium]|nr:helix-turn-helix transcriptional regulator [Bacillota bacterium]MDW7677226.1 helix-turn-helix transcriptional regulator [Bacillota bacterium]